MRVATSYPDSGETCERHRAPKNCPRCAVVWGEDEPLIELESESKSVGVHGMPDLYVRHIPASLLCEVCGWWVEIEGE